MHNLKVSQKVAPSHVDIDIVLHDGLYFRPEGEVGLLHPVCGDELDPPERTLLGGEDLVDHVPAAEGLVQRQDGTLHGDEQVFTVMFPDPTGQLGILMLQLLEGNFHLTWQKIARFVTARLVILNSRLGDGGTTGPQKCHRMDWMLLLVYDQTPNRAIPSNRRQ